MSTNRPRDEIVEINDLNFHIREWGDSKTKQAVILLHGYAETMAVWDDVAMDLAREFRVIAIDQRGHGETGLAPDHDYSRNSQMEDLELVVEHLGLRQVTLVGHAMGGANAICYAAEHPEAVTALIVVETAPEVLRSGIEGLRRLLATQEEFSSIDEAIETFREFMPYATHEQLERRVRASLAEGDSGSYVWSFDPVFRDPLARPPDPDPGQRRLADLWDCADRVQCPTMIVRGAETDMLTPEAIQRIHRRIVGSRVSLIEDAGHNVPTDQPANLALNIREFLQSLAGIA
jgi:esterase